MSLTAQISTPPLLEGDYLSSDEFMSRWDAMPDLKRAELIDGIVYMSSPVGRPHGRFEGLLHGWLAFYALDTPGCETSIEATWLMTGSDVPQPDITLTIVPGRGGQSTVKGAYYSGAPELIVEVAVSSYSRDFGAKKRLYEKMGVREYIVALPEKNELFWFEWTAAGFQPIPADEAGIFQSRFFPGLWLDASALWNEDLTGIHAAVQRGLATPEHAVFVARRKT